MTDETLEREGMSTWGARQVAEITSNGRTNRARAVRITWAIRDTTRPEGAHETPLRGGSHPARYCTSGRPCDAPTLRHDRRTTPPRPAAPGAAGPWRLARGGGARGRGTARRTGPPMALGP